MFGAPTVLTVVLGGTLSDFIVMQVLGIAFFMTAANTAHLVVARIGAIRTILLGSALSTLGCFAMGVYAAMDGTQAEPIWVLFILVNLGLGLRGPPGFYQAIVAAGQNESRGSALIILLAMLITALGTVAVAPWLQAGLLPLASAATAVSVVSLAVLRGMTDPAPS